MQTIDVRNEPRAIPFTRSVNIVYGTNGEGIIVKEGNEYLDVLGISGEKVKIRSMDVDALIRGLQALKECI